MKSYCAGRDPESKFSLKIRDKFAKGSTLLGKEKKVNLNQAA
jgi:hypothetical protein